MRANLSFGQAVHVYILVLAFGAVLYLIGLFVGRSYQEASFNDAGIAEASLEPVEDLSTQLEFYEQLSDEAEKHRSETRLSDQEPPVEVEAGGGSSAASPLGVVYTIQIGAHSTEEEARELLIKLQARDFHGRIRSPLASERPKYFRVWVGEFDSMQEALALETRLKEAGFYTYVRRVE